MCIKHLPRKLHHRDLRSADCLVFVSPRFLLASQSFSAVGRLEANAPPSSGEIAMLFAEPQILCRLEGILCKQTGRQNVYMPRADKLSPGGVKFPQPRDFQLPLLMSVNLPTLCAKPLDRT